MESTPSPDINDTHVPDTYKRVRNAVVLPDGTRQEPMGSGIITGILGVGGMANVYEIWNPQLEMGRAIKLLHPNYTEDAKQRFQTEIKITAKLHHPNIIEIHAVGQWNNLPYIEMEKIDGVTLETMITDRGALPIEVSTSIGILVARALRYAHNQEYVIYGKTYHGVIHRDLKPSNIMVAKNGSVKLMDFGIARPTDASIHTTDGSILGTMQYLSPEQLDGKEADIRTDIYSLGTIIYELVTGVKAFPEINVSKLMMSKVKNEFKSLDQFNIKIPPKLRKVIHRCLIHDREKRIPDAATLLVELTRIHKSIVGSTPEQVLQQYMNATSSGKNVVSIRKKIPIALIAGLTTAIAVGILGYKTVPPLLSHFSYNQTLAVPSEKKATLVNQIKSEPTIPLETAGIAMTEKHNIVRQKHSQLNPIQKIAQIPVAVPDQDIENKPVTLIDKLKVKFGSSDVLTIFTKEIQSGKYEEALLVYNYLQPNEMQNDKVQLSRIRALTQLGRSSEARAIIGVSTINDGEIYLEKAKMNYINGDLNQTTRYLTISSKTPAMFMDAIDLRRECLYYQALCMTKEFDRDKSKAACKKALEGWYEVKSELRSSMDHQYYKSAVAQMDRLAASK